MGSTLREPNFIITKYEAFFKRPYNLFFYIFPVDKIHLMARYLDEFLIWLYHMAFILYKDRVPKNHIQ